MKIKRIIIVIVIVIILGLVFWYLDSKVSPNTEEENPVDEISQILIDLENETIIEFSEIQDEEVQWMVINEGVMDQIKISGKGFKAAGVYSAEEQKVVAFFENNGFEVDVYNVAAGTIGSLTGYRRGNVACIIINSLWLDEVGDPLGDGKLDIDVSCGKSEQSLEPVFTTQELIAKLFAEKYDKKSSEVLLSFNAETESHARGMVKFSSEPEAEGGIFLATKINGEWQLVFDGNGGFSCEELISYNFPEEMMEGCFEEAGE